MNYLSHLECGLCKNTYASERLWNLCPRCQRPLLARYDLQSAKKNLKFEIIKNRSPNMWRYWEILPVRNPENILTLGEGFTPLLPAHRIARELQMKNLLVKEEGLNPTTSFKARGLSAAVSKAKELGVKSLSIPSAGNAGCAMSAYAALAGMEAHIFMPSDVPKPFIDECVALGAHVTLIDGLITDCAKAAAVEIEKFDRFDLSTLKEPYRLEGKKTMGYELFEQLDEILPDVIIYPTGGGTGLVGMWKAFSEMEEMEWLGKQRPRMISVQSSGCAPIVKAFHEEKRFADFWPDAKTIADGIRVPAAVGDFLILDALRESHGTAVTVSDPEIMEAANWMGRSLGIFPAPEGAATLAALKKLLDQGLIAKDESVVLFNTGSGHKYHTLWDKKA